MTKATLIRTATMAALIVMTLLGRSTPVTAADPAGKTCVPPFRFTATRPRNSSRSASARASSSTCRATSRTCWWPIPRSPTRSSARRAAPTSSASRSARPTSISSTPKASSSMAFDIAVTRDLNGIRAALKRALPDADIEVEGLADGIMLTGTVASPTEGAAGLRSRRRASPATSHQGRQRHHGARPRPGDAQGHGRRGAARRHQAARHRSQRQRCPAARRCSTSTTPIRFPVLGQALVNSNAVTGDLPRRQRDACGRWSAPASSARWPSRT